MTDPANYANFREKTKFPLVIHVVSDNGGLVWPEYI